MGLLALFVTLIIPSGEIDAEESNAPSRHASPVVVGHPGGIIKISEIGRPSGLAPDLVSAAETAAAELPLRVGLGLPRSVEVLICGDAESFARFAGRSRAGSLLGVALTGRGVAALNAPLLAPAIGRAPEGVLRHELAHLALGVAEPVAAPLPRWFEEGVASWFSGGMTELGPLDFASIQVAPDLALERLAFGFPEDPAAMRVAYVKSQLAIEHLESRHGLGTVAAIGAALGRGVPFDLALDAVTGLSTAALDRELSHAQAPHGVFIAVLRRSFSPFLVAAAITIIAFVLRRRRLKRRLRAWEEADRDPAAADERQEPR